MKWIKKYIEFRDGINFQKFWKKFKISKFLGNIKKLGISLELLKNKKYINTNKENSYSN